MSKLLGLLVIAACICLGSSLLHAQSDSARLEQVIKDAGFGYTTHNANTWSIEFERKTIGKFRVIISTGSDIVVTFAILAKKANINKTPKMMDALLLANHEYDFVKIGLDKDGDMFVRIDTLMHSVNSSDLKATINQVASASEEVFVKVASSIRR